MAEYDSVIPAGGSGTLKAKVHTRNDRSLTLTKTVTVTTDSQDVPQIRLTFKLKAEAAIAVSPHPSLMISARVGESASGRLLLHRADGKQMEMGQITVSGLEHVTARAIDVERENETWQNLVGQPRDQWLEVTVGPQARVGAHGAQAIVTTNHPELPELRVHLSVRVRDVIEVLPAEVQIRLRDGHAMGRYATANLRHGTNQKYEITGVEVSAPEVFEVSLTTVGARPNHQLRIKLRDEVNESELELPFRGMVKVSTSDPAKPLLELPVTVAEQRRDPRRPPGPRTARPSTGRPQPTTPATDEGEKAQQEKDKKPD